MTAAPFNPERILERIAARADEVSRAELQTAFQALAERYRAGAAGFGPGMNQRIAYAAARAPSTFAAMTHALQALKASSRIALVSQLDLGAGPGASVWAGAQVFPAIARATLIEADASMSRLSSELAAGVDGFPRADFVIDDLRMTRSFLRHDLVTASYVLNELSEADALALVKRAYEAAAVALVLTEPGHRTGFERLRAARMALLDMGAVIAAPCTHHAACPMGPEDWCHFAQDVPRSAVHRLAKSAQRSDEREKFSYLAVLRDPAALHRPADAARIVREPMRRSGHVHLDVCAAEGLTRRTVSRRDGAAYGEARSSAWGDLSPAAPRMR